MLAILMGDVVVEYYKEDKRTGLLFYLSVFIPYYFNSERNTVLYYIYL